MSKSVQELIDIVLPKLRARLEEDLAPWFGRKEVHDFMNEHGVDRGTMAAMWNEAAKHIGQRVEIRPDRWREVDELEAMIRDNGGVMDESVTQKFRQAHPGLIFPSLVAAARRRCGLLPTETSVKARERAHRTTGASALGNLGTDINAAVSSYTRLVREKEDLEARLEKIKGEILAYEPVVRALEGVRAAVRRMKETELPVS